MKSNFNNGKMREPTMALDTGALISAYCKKKRIYKSALARKLEIDYSSLFYHLKTKSMDLNRLIAFSEVFNHNFLMDLAVQLPSSFTTDAAVDPSKDEEIVRLKEQVKTLETEKEILLKVLGNRV